MMIVGRTMRVIGRYVNAKITVSFGHSFVTKFDLRKKIDARTVTSAGRGNYSKMIDRRMMIDMEVTQS